MRNLVLFGIKILISVKAQKDCSGGRRKPKKKTQSPKAPKVELILTSYQYQHNIYHLPQRVTGWKIT